MITCKDCPNYKPRNDGTDKGWCALFNVFARECHQQTRDCRNEMAVEEQPQEEPQEQAPAKQPKQVRQVKQVSNTIYMVVGSTGNKYHVDTCFGEYVCNCIAGQHNRGCYHVKAAKAKQQEQRQQHSDRNGVLKAELDDACAKHGVSVGRIDWLSFSAEIYFGPHLIGTVGNNLMRGYYFNTGRGNSVAAGNLFSAIGKLKILHPKARA